ncbi:hypothetical protein GCM10023065_30720 [Microbacterium laevaniformans]
MAHDVGAPLITAPLAVVDQEMRLLERDPTRREPPQIGQIVVSADTTGHDVQHLFPPGRHGTVPSGRYAITAVEHVPTISQRPVGVLTAPLGRRSARSGPPGGKGA